MKEQTIIPVYMLTGFIESGKTTMIRSMLADENFSSGQRTLIICCEEGIEEYEPELLSKANAFCVQLEDAEDLTSLRVKQLNNEYKPERVIIEFNNFWGIEMMARVKMPPRWELVQIISLADATTFDNYMLNMRKLLTDPMKAADLILVNRCGPGFNKSGWRKQLRALNPSANILFENPDGTTEDGVTDEDLPYDMKADVIDITDDDFGILYLDAMDHPERYNGRVLRMVGQAFPDSQFPAGYYLFARYAMTCCANDVQPCGWVCRGSARPDPKGFIRLTAKCQVVTAPDGQPGIMLIEQSTERASAPKDKYVTFGTV
ncbi:MAG: GTPase [Clostridia bacterium]|nr:GTPase [Clostridia bacterium]